ncbi:MAG: sodium:glutamate symporter [Bacteroidales bacterium]|nr:sodium:glutamate symporter [Bacteroidales bacterium]
MFDFTNFTPWSFFTDLGFLCALLLVGKFLRVKVRFIQRLFIPPSLLAGLLGLAFGPNGLGWIPLSDNIGTYAAILIAVVFGALPFSSPRFKVKEVARRVGPMWAYSQFGMLFQWAVMGLFGLLVLRLIWPELNPAFGVMLPTGFYGGHGTAAAIGSAFDSLGWDEAASLGMTTATIGVIVAILGGLLFIKAATKKGETSYIADFNELPDEYRSGLLPEDKREPTAIGTTSPISIDSHMFHLALVILAAFCGYLMSKGVKMLAPKLELPVFSCAFVCGMLIKWIFNKVGAEKYIDPKTAVGISSSATDLLVTCGVASIKLGVVAKYALPLVVLTVVGIAVTVFTVFWFGRRLNRKDWFEKSVFAWGWWTGTMAMGIALLRIVDPKQQSKAMDDYALAYLPCAPVEILLITFVPILFASGRGLWLMLACLVLSLLIIWLAKRLHWWNSKQK